VRAEFGDGYSLSHIAATWGDDVSAEELAALRELEALWLAESVGELGDEPVEGFDVDSSKVGD
jgi:hypothetical protein